MKILAFDTCWQACSAAIAHVAPGRQVDIVTSEFSPMTTGQAEALPVMLASVLSKAGLKARDLDRVAVANGPGSFTGVRIGIAAARALKLAASSELVTCSSLHVLARTYVHLAPDAMTCDIMIAMDARRGQVYVQMFSKDADEILTQPALLNISEAALLVAGKPVQIAGSAATIMAEAVTASGAIAQTVIEDVLPDAADLALLAPRLTPLDGPLNPVYLRPPDAKPPSAPGIARSPT